MADVVESGRSGVPRMDVLVSRRVCPLESLDELPFVVHAPKILESVVGILDGHVVNGMGHTEDTFALLPRMVVHKIDTWKIGGNV